MQNRQGATILVVEDEPAIRGLIAASLRIEGYRVLEARNGREALEIFDGTVDLLLTDMQLPHVSGQSVITQLRAQRRTLKVLTMSGFPGAGPTDEAITFMAKPFSRQALLANVRAILSGTDGGL